jgi:hypothetical protein
MRASFVTSVASLSSAIATMRKDLEMARETHDPHAMGEVEAKANQAQQRVDDALKAMSVVMVPETLTRLRLWHGSWSSREGKELIANADDLRRRLLRGVQLTPEDKAAKPFR